MARNPNSLPESKEYFVQALVCKRRILSRLADQAASLALVMYHAEVPFSVANRYMQSLASRNYRAVGDPQMLPESHLQQMFIAAGARLDEALRYLATLAPKRSPRR